MRLRIRKLSDESGMTLIEVIVGMFVLALTVGAMADLFANNSQASLGSQRQTQLVSVLQQRIEAVEQIFTQNYSAAGMSALALASNPARPTDATLPSSPTDPNDFISPYVSGFTTASSSTAENFLIEKNYNLTSQGTVDGGAQTYSEELEVDPTNGKVAPVVYVDTSTGTAYSSAASVPSGDAYDTVYTFITAAGSAVGANPSLSCQATAGTSSNTAGDARRVIVAAIAPSTGRKDIGSNTPQWSSTIIAAPIPGNQCQAATGLRIGLNIA